MHTRCNWSSLLLENSISFSGTWNIVLEVDQLIRQAYALLPRVKITELLLEVDDLTGFYAALYAFQKSRSFKKSHSSANRDIGRRNQSRVNQNGGSMPSSDLRATDLAASMAHPRRDLFSCACTSGQCSISAPFRVLGPWHHVFIARSVLPCR